MTETDILFLAVTYASNQLELSRQYLEDSVSTDPRINPTWISNSKANAITSFSNAIRMIRWILARPSVNISVPTAFQDSDVTALGINLS